MLSGQTMMMALCDNRDKQNCTWCILYLKFSP